HYITKPLPSNQERKTLPSHHGLSAFPLLPQIPSSQKTCFFFSKSTSKTNTKSVSLFAREKEILSESDGQSPAVRFYENHLSRLTQIGDVSFEQALTAAAADGGETAEEHIVSAMSTMVLHTVFPGNNSDPHSTISTKTDILPTTTSKNILAMTFRQVVLQPLWSFELLIFSPGTERNMDNLANPTEVGLANILDMYYEDIYTIPDKQLSCGLVADFSKVTKNKRDSSSWQMLSITFAGACILVFTSIIAQLYVPHLFKSRKSPSENCSVSLSVDDRCQRQSLEATEVYTKYHHYPWVPLCHMCH
ncbi:uncharacterized protein LOC143888808, partial [Tasmannia lanceolata]|uniref:uncharacterized protein LOC143888808 n=1 Tax=Tasmannia lanceolata TaxID=3420 RepID=UPI004062BFA4